MCIQEVGRAEVDGIKSHMRRSCRQRTLYSSDVACAHIESLPTHSAVEVIRRPYRSSRCSALYLAHSFSIRLVTSGEAIPNRRNDRIVARTLMLCRCSLSEPTILPHSGQREPGGKIGPLGRRP